MNPWGASALSMALLCGGAIAQNAVSPASETTRLSPPLGLDLYVPIPRDNPRPTWYGVSRRDAESILPWWRRMCWAISS